MSPPTWWVASVYHGKAVLSEKVPVAEVDEIRRALMREACPVN